MTTGSSISIFPWKSKAVPALRVSANKTLASLCMFLFIVLELHVYIFVSHSVPLTCRTFEVSVDMGANDIKES